MFILIVLIVHDGKALADGPVVISPDGLFPFLYWEVDWWYMQKIFKDIYRFYFYQSMLFEFQAFYLSLGMPCNNPDKQKFQSESP